MNPPYKALIIDDEAPARMLIRDYLQAYPQIQVVAECDNGFEGVRQIQQDQPDLIFLDVQMPKLNGFEMLELLDPVPLVIFSTAFDQYAIRAFELNAADYLLKPYSKERFDQAVQKALVHLSKDDKPSENLNRISASALPEGEYLDRFVVRTGTKIKVIPAGQIEYFEAEDDYVMIHTPEGRFMKQMTMGYVEAHLDPREFVRIHRSCLVQISLITQLEPYDRDTRVVVLRSGVKIKTSRSGLKRLREVLGF